MPTMTNNEMTAFLASEAIARAEARTLANIARRASSLFSDGYTAQQTADGLFLVTSPAGDFYSVRVSDLPAGELFGSSCSCPCFESRKTCKHLQALVMAIEEGAEGDAREEAILNNDDDRYPKF